MKQPQDVLGARRMAQVVARLGAVRPGVGLLDEPGQLSGVRELLVEEVTSSTGSGSLQQRGSGDVGVDREMLEIEQFVEKLDVRAWDRPPPRHARADRVLPATRQQGATGGEAHAGSAKQC